MFKSLNKIDAKEFKYKNHELNWWSVFGLSYTESMELDKLIAKINEYAVGYCDGSVIECRPRKNSYAVMFEMYGERFWFHIEETENTIMNDFLDRIKSEK